MLGKSSLCAFVATAKAAEAKQFYENVLGLELTEDSPFALVFEANGTMLRVQKVKEFTPHPFTALGWNVKDIGTEMTVLEKKGVTFMRIGFPGQDERGIWTAPDTTKVAWFKDPDGNTLSLAQFS
jgi:catechol 2,3-dioxygenase-like lactoylglutathione lyase family enzyme